MLRDHQNRADECNPIVLFFEDVARLPVISNRNQYIPLIRCIQRGTLLRELTGGTGAATLCRIQTELQSIQTAINDSNQKEGGAFLNIYRLSTEIESFLEDPTQTTTPTISICLGSKPEEEDVYYQKKEELVWRFFYLLSLIPLSSRGEFVTILPSQAVTDHFSEITTESLRAQRILSEGMMRYVIKIARYYLNNNIPFLDLIQEGYMGLLRATEIYNERLGTPFQSHAVQWIRQRVTRYVADSCRMIRLPVHAHEYVQEIDRQYEEQTNKLGYPPGRLEFAVAEGWITEEQLAIAADENKRIRLLQRLDEYKRLLSLVSKDPDDVPIPDKRKVTLLRNTQKQLEEKLGRPPSHLELFVAVGWMTEDEFYFYKLVQSAGYKEKVARAVSVWHATQKRLNLYSLGKQTHYSLERFRVFDENCCSTSLANWLVAEVDPIQEVGTQLAADALENVMLALTERQRTVLMLRFGLQGNLEHTLEEIGEKDGLTRERIRQIEAKAIRRLQHPTRSRKLKAYFESDYQLSESINASQIRKLRHALNQIESTYSLVGEYHEDREIEYIDQLINRYLPKGRRRVLNTHVRRGRAELFRQILLAADQPLHFMEIHAQAIERVPAELAFSAKTTYSTLFYYESFRAFGKGRFGLVEWGSTADTERALLQCPQPLLANSGDPRSFFESIMVARTLLRQKPGLSVRQFYLEMLGWAGRTTENVSEAQAAFDAWYAAGLFDRINYLQEADRLPVVKIAPDAKLNDVRMHCLKHICQRILKIPELLLTLEQIAHPTVAEIQKVLFGVDTASPDVEARLSLLAAFDAVRRDGNMWTLGTPGKAALQANPPQDLPDFDEIMAAQQPEEAPMELEWEDELDLLDEL